MAERCACGSDRHRAGSCAYCRAAMDEFVRLEVQFRRPVRCDLCGKDTIAATLFTCRKCVASFCEACLGDYDYDTDNGSVAFCVKCKPPKVKHEPIDGLHRFERQEEFDIREEERERIERRLRGED